MFLLELVVDFSSRGWGVGVVFMGVILVLVVV